MTVPDQAGHVAALEIPFSDAAVEMENRQQVLTALTADADEAMASYRTRRPA